MTSSLRLGAFCWLVTAEFFLTQFIAQSGWPEYSLAALDISMLGLVSCAADSPCSPLHAVFNMGIILHGVLVLLGIWLTTNSWPQGRWRVPSLCLLALGGIGSMLVGIFPLDVHLTMHMAGAFLALCVACFGFAGVGLVVRATNPWFAVYCWLTGVVTLSAFLLYVLGQDLSVGRGTLERLAAWPQTLWYMITGALLLGGRLRSSAA